ncbi:hypothetical protein Bca52824_015206 [Brassica carinata]|uniref:Ubiquitin-like protease family profile domain-containing protein n=1 Tax=Brassica carinata TaxID=52824 RepID=A0A8X7W181_BRACI|nr:hypothetical protein Bca52824_015206 [Brassica carinata]
MEDNGEDHLLPERLFATDRFPCQRLNIYSRPNILAFIRHVLRDTAEFKKIRESPFGKLFDLPTHQCAVSCKLIHALMSRQLLVDLQYTFWTVFGSDPLRFSLEEFGTITGLNCGAFPEGYEAPDLNHKGANKQKNAHKDPTWRRLVGKNSNITIADLADDLENDREMDDWRRIRLPLLIIVDGVLVASKQVHRPTLRYVKMLEDVDAFLEFPWGRESFLHTVRTLKPPKFEKGKPVDDPVGMLVSKLKQKIFRLTGFPLALQLLAFRAVPTLLPKRLTPSHVQTIMDVTEPDIPLQNSIEINEILLVEDSSSTRVSPRIPVIRGPQPGWGEWSDENIDEKVKYMEQLISNNYTFAKSMWPGGDSSEPLHVVISIPDEPVHKKHIVERKRKDTKLKPRKAPKKSVSAEKIRRITRLCAASTSTPDTSNALEGRITILETRVTTLEKANERLKELLRRKRWGSRAGPVFAKFAGRHRRRIPHGSTHNSDPPHGDANVSPYSTNCQINQDVHMKDGYSADPEDPILSQYRVHHNATQRSRLSIVDPTDHNVSDHQHADHPLADHQTTVHNTTEHHSNDHHSSASDFNQAPPDHTYPIQGSPIHTPDAPNHVFVTPQTPDHHSPINNSLPPASPTHTISLKHNSTQPTTPNSPTQRSPTHAPLFIQGSPSQHSPPISTLPHFDATPLNNPNSQGAVPIYDSSALQYSQSPTFTPPPAVASTPSPSNKSLGFSPHSSTPNAFAATATVKGSTSLSKTSLSLEAKRSKDGDTLISDDSPEKTIQRANTTGHQVCELSDSSPAKKKPKHSFSEEEKALAQALIECRTLPHYLIITHPPLELWNLFYTTLSSKPNIFHLTPSKFDFQNKWLLQLATPQKWTDSLHMALIMHMLEDRHKDILTMEKSTFTGPALTSLMQSKGRQFLAAVDKAKFHWDPRLTKLLLLPGKTWFKPVEIVYTPMVWADKHWVGLVINLIVGHVDVLDPLPGLYGDDKVLTFLKPMLHMLPYLSRYVAKDNSRDLSPFTWQRIQGIYENTRGGDCGPVSAKLMELHLYSDPHPHMRGLTDDNVDKFRQLYAMEAYKTIVLPAYLATTTE